MRNEFVVAWLLTLALQVGALVLLAWLLDRWIMPTRLAWRELLWRTALFGGVLTASAPILLGVPSLVRFALPLTDATPSFAQTSNETVVAMLPSRLRTIVAIALSTKPLVPGTAVTAARAKSADRLHAGSDSLSSAAPGIRSTPASRLLSWQRLLVAGWLAGALLSLARLFSAWLRLERELAGAKPLDNAAIASDAAALAIQARIAIPTLAIVEDLASPIAALGGRIVVPRWALEVLDRDQLRAMLAHETAHLARCDPWWKLAGAALCAVLWFLPLAIARRRLDEIAELACDAWAACHLGDGRSLAECLAECAGQRGSEFDIVPAMAHRDSPLLQRIDRLIAGAPVDAHFPRARATVAVVLALTLAAFALPGFTLPDAIAQVVAPTPPAPPTPPGPPSALASPPEPASTPAPSAPPLAPATGAGSHVHISSTTGLFNTGFFGSGHESTSVEISHDGHAYGARIDGKIAFNDRDDDIASLDDGGSASFIEKHLGNERRVDYASHGGKLERRYFVDGHEQPIDAAAQVWIAGIVGVVIRNTAIDAAARVKRIYAKDGAGAVLDEIGRIDSGYARGVYLKGLCEIGKLDSADVTRAIGLIDGTDSDYERRNALAALAASQPLNVVQQKLVIGQADKIGSDYERAELLLAMLPKLVPDPALRQAWLHAASGIGSDYERERVLAALLAAGPVDDATLDEIIGAAKSISSDYERSQLLAGAIRHVSDADRVATAYAAATAQIGSDYERRQALLALIAAPRFGATGARAVLDVANKIGSDYECGEVLVALARVMPNNADLFARYRTVARKLSDTERAAAERALDRFAG